MQKSPSSIRIAIRSILSVVSVLAFIYVFPRLILQYLEPSDPWASYLYQYGFGFAVSLIGLILIIKTKALRFGRGRDSYWFKWIVAGLVVYAAVHAIWILLALNMPVKGGV